MLIIGLTGGIGSGKTTVSDLFSELAVPVIDTDIIARELVEPGQESLKKIVKAFGQSVLKNNNELDRKKLADITFKNSDARKKLEDILHPEIRQKILTKIKNLSSPYCIVVIPLLFETGQAELVDRILLIDCPVETQIKRVKQRDQRPEQQILSIISTQTPRKIKQQNTNDIINNNDSIEQLKNQVTILHKKYLDLASNTA